MIDLISYMYTREINNHNYNDVKIVKNFVCIAKSKLILRMSEAISTLRQGLLTFLSDVIISLHYFNFF